MLKTVSSVTNAIGALNYKGTWNASTNTPTLVSSVGVKGDYYVVSTAGNTNLNGETLWGVGDWAVFNGSIWQKVDGGDTSAVTSLTVTSLTGYMYANNSSAVTASTTIPVASVTGAVPNTVNVLAGSGLSGGGALTGNVTLSVTANSVNQNVTVQNNNVLVGSEPAINFIPGANITITTANSPSTGQANVTIGVSGLGTMAFQNANNVAITGGTINVQATNLTATTTGNATYATSSLLLVPAGFLEIDLNGTVVKVPYYSV